MTQAEKFAKISPQPSALSLNSVQKYPREIIIGSQVFRKCTDLFMLRHYCVFSRGYTNKELDAVKWRAKNESDFHRLFFRTKELFDKAGLKFSLAYGSLLGAVREGGPIKGDNDMDLFIWDEAALLESLPELQKEGLLCLYFFPGNRYTFTLDKTSFIDVYILSELTGIRKFFWGKSCVSLFVFETPRSLFTGWSEINFMGEKVTCPQNPERLLEFWYGPDWRIPQDKKGTYRVKSAELYHRFLAFFYRRPYLLYSKLKVTAGKVFRLIFSNDYRHKILQRKKETGSYFGRQ